jgi:hypothetical protein
VKNIERFKYKTINFLNFDENEAPTDNENKNG